MLAAARAAGYPAFFTRHMSLPVRLMGTAEPGERANAASVAGAMAGAGMVLVAVPGTAVTVNRAERRIPRVKRCPMQTTARYGRRVPPRAC